MKRKKNDKTAWQVVAVMAGVKQILFSIFLIFWNVDGCQGTTRQLKTEAVNFAEGRGMHVALQQCFNDG